MRLCIGLCILATSAQAASSFIEPLKAIQKIASTVPSNGDINPYGVAVVSQTTGALVKGDILVSNFNNVKNFQGTGTTICRDHAGRRRQAVRAARRVQAS